MKIKIIVLSVIVGFFIVAGILASVNGHVNAQSAMNDSVVQEETLAEPGNNTLQSEQVESPAEPDSQKAKSNL
jgi:Flp pilus assembly protein CpaB